MESSTSLKTILQGYGRALENMENNNEVPSPSSTRSFLTAAEDEDDKQHKSRQRQQDTKRQQTLVSLDTITGSSDEDEDLELVRAISLSLQKDGDDDDNNPEHLNNDTPNAFLEGQNDAKTKAGESTKESTGIISNVSTDQNGSPRSKHSVSWDNSSDAIDGCINITTPTAESRKRQRTGGQEELLINVPFGYFTGKEMFRNRLNDTEKLEQGHVSMYNLIPPDCQLALVTTFETPSQRFVKRNLHQIPQVIFVAHSKPPGLAQEDESLSGPPVGSARAEPFHNKPNWYWIAVTPHVGLMHAKILLFRCPEGLRIVVSGNNFGPQWFMDRDCLWVQDVPKMSDESDNVADANNCTTKETELVRLRSFLEDLTTSLSHGNLIQEKIGQLFDGIHPDALAGVRFVYSFPRESVSTGTRADRGGWQQLAHAIYRFRKDAGHSTSYSTFEKQQRELEDLRLYAMSGSLGNLLPDFLLQMKHAMSGKMIVPPNAEWSDIQRMYILWPSQQTAETMILGSARAISRDHWAGIAEGDRRRIFFDAPPNPSTKALQNHNHAFAHGKVMCAEQDDSWGAICLGSHNFSKAAWGLRNCSPRNVEFSVVLFTEDSQTLKNWQARLPYQLPGKDSRSLAEYEPGRPKNCESLLQQMATLHALSRANDALLITERS